MKELDFLPEWYKEGRRRRSHMRRQYVALAVIFVAMMAFNLTATHRAGKAAAELTHFEEQRMRAEGTVHEFSVVTKELNQLKVKADLMERMDSKIDVAAVLAEMSCLITGPVALSRAEFIGEPLFRSVPQESGSAVRTAGAMGTSEAQLPFGRTRFRIVLAGVAAHPSHVADLVCRLDESSYFQRVYPSFSRPTKIQIPGVAGGRPQTNTAPQRGPETLEVTEFEITCQLANYKEIDL